MSRRNKVIFFHLYFIFLVTRIVNYFFKRLDNKKKNILKIDIFPETNEEYTSVTNGCFRFIDSFRFLSKSLDSLVKTFLDISHETLKNLKGEIVDNDEKVNIVTVIEEDRTIRAFEKYYPDKYDELEEDSFVYMGESDPKILKTEFPDNSWKYLTKKVAYPYEYFNSLDDYQKGVDNLKTEDFSVI